MAQVMIGQQKFGTSHIVENCPKCKGTHIGSYDCPIFCICCASGDDLPEGEECQSCGRIGALLHVASGRIVYDERR